MTTGKIANGFNFKMYTQASVLVLNICTLFIGDKSAVIFEINIGMEQLCLCSPLSPANPKCNIPNMPVSPSNTLMNLLIDFYKIDRLGRV